MLIFTVPILLSLFASFLVKGVKQRPEPIIFHGFSIPKPAAVVIRSPFPFPDPNQPGALTSKLYLTLSTVSLPNGSSNAIDLLGFEARSEDLSLRFSFQPISSFVLSSMTSSIVIEPKAILEFPTSMIFTGDNSLVISWSKKIDGDIQTFDKKLTGEPLPIDLDSLDGFITITNTGDGLVGNARMWSELRF
jgi:hypothetical protein